MTSNGSRRHRQRRRAAPAVDELAHVAEQALRGRRRGVAVDVDALEDLVGVLTRSLGADHRDAQAGGDERPALLPDPAVEGHR
jgi:hypothetical protein